MTATRVLLRRLAAHDARYLQPARPASSGSPAAIEPPALDRGVRALVTLAALLAADAPTPSLRWAVDRVADDRTVVQVLGAAAGPAGAAQTVKSAERLALALESIQRRTQR